jgi:hypothetical protein
MPSAWQLALLAQACFSADTGGGSLEASSGYCWAAKFWSKSIVVTGVTGIMLIPCTYSSSLPNHVETVASKAPMLPTMREAEKMAS